MHRNNPNPVVQDEESTVGTDDSSTDESDTDDSDTPAPAANMEMLRPLNPAEIVKKSFCLTLLARASEREKSPQEGRVQQEEERKEIIDIVHHKHAVVSIECSIAKILTEKREEIESSGKPVSSPFNEQAKAVCDFLKSKTYVGLEQEKIAQLCAEATTLLESANLLELDRDGIDDLAHDCVKLLYGWVSEAKAREKAHSSGGEPSGQVNEAEASGPASKRAHRS